MSSPVVNAFVLGAGLGTRLRPLTERRPKPLVPLYNKPLITFAFDHLLASGIESFVVNTHHCPDAYDRLLGAHGGRAVYREHPVTLRHEPLLLDTGGGIKNVEDVMGDNPFIVYNGDILADFPLRPLVESHLASGNLATLALRSSGGPLHIQCEPDSGLVTDIRRAIGGQNGPSFLFTGVSVLSPEIFKNIPAGRVVSIIPIYLDIIRRGGKIGGIVMDDGLWFDLGTREAYLDAHRLLVPGGYRIAHAPAGWPRPIHESAAIHPDARLHGICAVGPGADVGAGTTLRDSILWENSSVGTASTLDRCIVTDGRRADGNQDSADF